MAKTRQLSLIVDRAGRVVAAAPADEPTRSEGQDEAPAMRLVPLQDQREVRVDVAEEVLSLPGAELHKFLSEVQVRWPADVQLPKFDIHKHRP